MMRTEVLFSPFAVAPAAARCRSAAAARSAACHAPQIAPVASRARAGCGARSARRRCGRLGGCCAARGNGADGPRSPPPPPPEFEVEGDEFEDFPGADSARQWRALPADTRSIITVGAAFIAIPLLLSASLRLTVIDPLLFFLQADLHEFDLTPRQWNEITLEIEGLERRLKYDGLMGHAPRLSESQLDDRLREEGLRLEFDERQKSREAVGNTLSDTLGTVLLLAGLSLNKARLAALRNGVVSRFLALEVSTQAFMLLLAADITVGYHSSDGWVTFVELLVKRYNVNGAEGADNAIRLFVATVPVIVDVSYKYWVYKYLRRLSPGTQIILSEIERH